MIKDVLFKKYICMYVYYANVHVWYNYKINIIYILNDNIFNAILIIYLTITLK